MGKCQEILNEIDEKNLQEKFNKPCKIAEASYQIINLFPQNLHELQDECASYWNHLGKNFFNPKYEIPFNHASTYATKILYKSFGSVGGLDYVIERVKTNTFGFAKSIITDGFINEQRDDYIGLILHRYIDPRNYQDIKAVMEEYVQLFNVRFEMEGQLQFLIAHYEVVFKSHCDHHGKLDMDRLVFAQTR